MGYALMSGGISANKKCEIYLESISIAHQKYHFTNWKALIGLSDDVLSLIKSTLLEI